MARLLLSDENLRCSICLETFKEPKVLPCCHTFCKGYLSKLPMMKKPESELSVRGEQPSRDREPSPGVSTDHEVSDESDEGEEMLLETLSSDVTASVASEDAAQKILGPPDDHTDQEEGNWKTLKAGTGTGTGTETETETERENIAINTDQVPVQCSACSLHVRTYVRTKGYIPLNRVEVNHAPGSYVQSRSSIVQANFNMDKTAGRRATRVDGTWQQSQCEGF